MKCTRSIRLPCGGHYRGGRYPYVYVDRIYLRCNWGSAYENVAILKSVWAWLRHVAGTQWDNEKHMHMKHLKAALEDASIAG